MEICFKNNKYTFENAISLLISVLIFSFIIWGNKVNNLLFSLSILTIFIVFIILRTIKKQSLSLNTLVLVPILISLQFITSDILLFIFFISTFFMIDNLSNDKLNVLIILHSVALSGLFASLISIDSALGGLMTNAIGLNQAFSIDYKVHGIFASPDITSAFLCGCIFIFTALSSLTNNKIAKPTYACLTSIITIAVGVSMAKISLLLFAISLVLMLVITPKKENKIDLIAYLFVPIFWGFIFLLPVLKLSVEIMPIANHIEEILIPKNSGTMFTTIAAVTSFCSLFIYSKFKHKIYNTSSKLVFKVSVIIFLVLTFLSIGFFGTGLYKSLLSEEILLAISTFITALNLNTTDLSSSINIFATVIYLISLILIFIKYLKTIKSSDNILFTTMILGFSMILLLNSFNSLALNTNGILIMFISIIAVLKYKE